MFELDAPIAQRAGEKLDINAINAYLKTQDANVGSITEVAQFAGGYSLVQVLVFSCEAA